MAYSKVKLQGSCDKVFLVVGHFEWETCQTHSPVRSLLSVSFKHVLVNLNIFTGMLNSKSVLYSPSHGNVFIFLSKCSTNAEHLFGNWSSGRSQWPRGLRRRFVAARLLRLCFRIPPVAWIFFCCECCVLSGRGLCVELISLSEESYQL